MVSLMQRRREMLKAASSGGGGDDVSGYVSDGILLWFDGICNTAGGHNAASAKWEDLSGNGHHATYNANNIVGDNYLDTNGYGLSYTGFTTEEKSLYESSGTLELVIDPDSLTGNEAVFMPSGNTDSRMGQCYTHVGILKVGYWKYKGITMLSGAHYYSFPNLWRDGIVQQSSGSKQSWSYVAKFIFAYGNGNTPSYPFHGKVYALRAYGRALTDDEMMQNWLEDKRRFGIT